MKTDETIQNELLAATDGLLFMSESDFPFEPFAWPGPDAPTPEALRDWEKRPETPCETDDFARMFRAPTTEFPGVNDLGQERARRFRALVALLQESLSDIRVIRVGEVQKNVYVLGQTPNGNWLGLKTQVVET
jgi:hypothetical protein